MFLDGRTHNSYATCVDRSNAVSAGNIKIQWSGFHRLYEDSFRCEDRAGIGVV